MRDPAVHHEVCERVAAWVAAQPGWSVVGVVESPILGPQGNREFLLYARRSATGSATGEEMSDDTEPRAGFAGFRPAAFAFFRELRDNNDPAWFKPRKAILRGRSPRAVAGADHRGRRGIAGSRVPLVGDARHGIFRIYRDVRFSPDKRLYKTHAGAVLTRSGRKHDPGVLYLHVAPAESMVAAGFWHPEPALLIGCGGRSSKIPKRF